MTVCCWRNTARRCANGLPMRMQLNFPAFRLAFSALALAATALQAAEPVTLAPATMARKGTVDARFQSYNVEMVEVTGGRFWAPYKTQEAAKAQAPAASTLGAPALDPAAFRNREPINLASPKLRKLAAALGPAYVRVSGTWANSTYFQDSDAPAPATPPAGFGGVLTRAHWRGVLNFSKATNAKLITSFAISGGTRDAKGVWTPGEAAKVLAFTKAAGGEIAAAEFFNEPSFASMGGAPAGYDAAAYGRDFKVFLQFVKKNAPGMLILGPGSVGEAVPMGAALQVVHSQDMLTATGPGVDAFSYHFYGGVSKRCGYMAGAPLTAPAQALSEPWLTRTDRDAAFYETLRDRFEPGKPMWLTETAETACGGNPWAASFLDSFRYLDQLGRLAKRGVQVVAHNTLAASDYGLIDEETLTPRPNYWAALLWHRLMGTTVLDVGAANGLHVYAHCLAGKAGGVAVLALNPGSEPLSIAVPTSAGGYTLSSSSPEQAIVDLNGHRLALGVNDTLPRLKAVTIPAGNFTLAPATITFFEFSHAGNPACR